MRHNLVEETEPFSEVYKASDLSERIWINKIRDQLAEKLNVGKKLRFDWFREKKLRNKRLSFLINRRLGKALLIAFGTKKEQQKIIDYILSNKDKFMEYVR